MFLRWNRNQLKAESTGATRYVSVARLGLIGAFQYSVLARLTSSHALTAFLRCMTPPQLTSSHSPPTAIIDIYLFINNEYLLKTIKL